MHHAVPRRAGAFFRILTRIRFSEFAANTRPTLYEGGRVYFGDSDAMVLLCLDLQGLRRRWILPAGGILWWVLGLGASAPTAQSTSGAPRARESRVARSGMLLLRLCNVQNPYAQQLVVQRR